MKVSFSKATPWHATAQPSGNHGSFTALIVIAFILAGLFFGLVSSVLPWFIPTGFALLVVGTIVTITKPTLGLWLALAMLFEAIPSALQPKVPLGGGNLKLYDLYIILLLFVLFFNQLTTKAIERLKLDELKYPIIYLSLGFGIALIYGKFIAHNQDWLSEGRAAISWAVLPLAAFSCHDRKSTRTFTQGMVLLGLVLATYVTIQSFFGVRIMTEARVEALDVAKNSDITRSIADGGIYLIVFSLFFTINNTLSKKIPKPISVIFISILLLGIAVQFGRGIWIATALGMIISSYVYGGKRGVITIGLIGLLASSLLISAIAVVKPRVAEALIDRATGISQEIKSGSSFDWRKQENSAALTMISRRPILGVGIGGEYKQTISAIGSFGIETRYIHNAYLYFPLKMGIWAAFIPLCFMVYFTIIALRATRSIKLNGNNDLPLAAALCGAFFVPCLTSFTQPEWVASRGIAALCLFMAVMLKLRQFNQHTVPSPEK